MARSQWLRRGKSTCGGDVAKARVVDLWQGHNGGDVARAQWWKRCKIMSGKGLQIKVDELLSFK